MCIELYKSKLNQIKTSYCYFECHFHSQHLNLIIIIICTGTQGCAGTSTTLEGVSLRTPVHIFIRKENARNGNRKAQERGGRINKHVNELRNILNEI